MVFDSFPEKDETLVIEDSGENEEPWCLLRPFDLTRVGVSFSRASV